VQQSAGTPKQQFTFVNSKVADFDVQLDCDNNRVIVRTKGPDVQQQTLPIFSDGSINGTLRFKNQVADDGKGTGQCWLEYLVSFSGKATCETTTPDPTASPTPGQTPSQKGLSLTTEVSFDQTTLDALQQAGIGVEGPAPSPSPSDSVTPSPSPSESASPAPSQSPSPSPSPSPTIVPSPTPSPSISVQPIKVCKVEDPCPIENKTDLSCKQQ
jgi:hypothetical protein